MPAGRWSCVVGRSQRARSVFAGMGLVACAALPAQADTPWSADDIWTLHAQTTFVGQGYPNIRSPYQGDNSLPGKGQVRETWTTTLFLGRKLWDGAEIYFNPEMLQGFGLAHTLGFGGFPNGEAQKAGSETPRVRPQRYFFRQTFGLGGEQERVEDGPNQLVGKRDVDRITVTVGKFAIGDMFDNNVYAHDPRTDFMNWALWSSAAYDFPADLPGYTHGAVVELNRKHWAVRVGLFQVPSEPNSDVLTFKSHGALAEFEERHTILGQPGKLRLGVFSNRGRTGNYREALAFTGAGVDVNDVMDRLRRVRSKDGVYANLEQAVGPGFGMFARASWNDGKNEILSFTDIDRSLSGGVSIKGQHWSRPTDEFGLGAAINGLSGGHKDFLAAGGLGLLIGDGRLNYREEKILETYYAIGLAKWATLTFDYQFIANPAYNADRGPVSLLAARFHAEF
jgi:high affinity Mn2+ porin